MSDELRQTDAFLFARNMQFLDRFKKFFREYVTFFQCKDYIIRNANKVVINILKWSDYQ